MSAVNIRKLGHTLVSPLFMCKSSNSTLRLLFPDFLQNFAVLTHTFVKNWQPASRVFIWCWGPVKLAAGRSVCSKNPLDLALVFPFFFVLQVSSQTSDIVGTWRKYKSRLILLSIGTVILLGLMANFVFYSWWNASTFTIVTKLTLSLHSGFSGLQKVFLQV